MFQKHPVLGIILLGLAFVATLTAIDLVRSRKWFQSATAPADESNCTWKVIFQKSLMTAFEWPVLFNWLHGKVPFDVVNDNKITVTLDNTTKQALDQFGGSRGWKYEAVRQCPQA